MLEFSVAEDTNYTIYKLKCAGIYSHGTDYYTTALKDENRHQLRHILQQCVIIYTACRFFIFLASWMIGLASSYEATLHRQITSINHS